MLATKFRIFDNIWQQISQGSSEQDKILQVARGGLTYPTTQTDDIWPKGFTSGAKILKSVKIFVILFSKKFGMIGGFRGYQVLSNFDEFWPHSGSTNFSPWISWTFLNRLPQNFAWSGVLVSSVCSFVLSGVVRLFAVLKNCNVPPATASAEA